MVYAGVSAAAFLSFGMLVWETRRGTGSVTVLGLSGSRGFHLAAWGMALTMIAAPFDDLWHRLFGVDVTLWSPPHVLLFLGSIINGAACFVIAREVYPEGSRARLAAMLLAGAVIYGSLYLMIDPSFRISYLYGGIRFYSAVMLAALFLPLALVPTARLSGNRWAPVCVLVIVSLMGLAGHRIALIGFDMIQPVSVIEEEIAKDATSPIAVANIMARKNGTAPGRLGGASPLLYVGVAAVFAMGLVDARRRPLASTIAFSVVLFIGGGLFIARTPALAPMVPGAGPTAVAFTITLAAALSGGAVSRRFSDTLEA